MWYPDNKYPYTNFHDLNLDWVLWEIKTLRQMVESFEEEMLAKAYKYTDDEIVKALATIRGEARELENRINRQLDAMRNQINLFKAEVNAQIAEITKYLETSLDEINAKVTYFERLIDTKIEANNDYLLDALQKGMSNLYVINYFTGERVKIQDMFDYLAALHLVDAIRYDVLATRNITYDELAALMMTYTDLAAKGGILIPQKGA